MDAQLRLLDESTAAEPDWHLDDATRETGRDGVARARQALRAARRTQTTDDGSRAQTAA